MGIECKCLLFEGNSPQNRASQYLIVGRGRLAKALSFYLDSVKISYCTASKKTLQNEIKFRELTDHLKTQTPQLKAVLLCVSDFAIEEVAQQFLKTLSVPVVHFSGSVQCEKTFAFHPLYSFSDRPIPKEEFENIPFILDPQQTPTFKKIFSSFKNPTYESQVSKNPLYHALCVCMGNLSQNLQTEALDQLQARFQLETSALLPFLKSLVNNLEFRLQQPDSASVEAISGPIARKDKKILQSHLKNLESVSPLLKNIYSEFIKNAGLGDLDSSLKGER